MSKLSVVILNFNRPDFIKNNIIPILLKNKNIDEIIVSHGKKSTYFEKEEVTSLKHYGEINKSYGLSRRFLSGSQAKNNYVMIMDDDIIPSEKTIHFLYEKIINDPRIIHGFYGRDIMNEYKTDNVFGDVPIVLTRCLVSTKSMCQYFMKNFRKLENEDVKNSKPYWNGEDILFSLLSIKRSKRLNKSYDLSHYNRTLNYINFSESISLKNPLEIQSSEHLSYRKKITDVFVKKLNIEKEILKTKINSKRSQVGYFVENSVLIYYVIVIIILLALYFGKKYF